MRRFMSLALALIMVAAIAAPMFASSDVKITAVYNKNTKTVTITVGSVTQAFANINNNTTMTFTVNGWEVSVTAKNDVATINSKKQVAPTPTPTPKVMPTPTPAFTNNSSNLSPQQQSDTLELTPTLSLRNNSSGEKIPSNAHSGNFPGIYFIWDSKQKDPGKLYVQDWVFDLFEDAEFFITAQNSNRYWDYAIKPVEKHAKTNKFTIKNVLQTFHYEYHIPKVAQSGSLVDELKNINQIFIGGKYKRLELWNSTLQKTVDGTIISEWVIDTDYDINELVKGITFKAYIVDGYQAPFGKQFAIGTVDTDGIIMFDKQLTTEGWFAIVEEFVAGSLAEKLFDKVEPLYVFYNGENIIGSSFDYKAFYKIFNGWGTSEHMELNYPGLNLGGVIFDIALTNTNTGVQCLSFCAYGASRAFTGESGLDCVCYVVAEPEGVDRLDFVQVFNYIEDNIGLLSENRVLTQMVIWTLLGFIDIYSAEFNAIDNVKVDKAAIVDVIGNYKGYVGNGKIVDAVYMVCERDHAYIDCQPQFVPIYVGKITFDNKPMGN